jgi:hypothetical protein
MKLPTACDVAVIPTKKTVSQSVIPAKSRETGREPGSRSSRDHSLFWIPDLVMHSITRPE